MTLATSQSRGAADISDAALEDLEGGLNIASIGKALLRKWWLIATMTVLTTTLAGVRVLSSTAVYRAQFELLIQAGSTETEIISDVPDTLTARPEQVTNTDLLKLLTSPTVLQPVIDGIRDRYPGYCPPLTSAFEQNYDPCYNRLASQLRVSPLGKGSNIVQVSFQSPDLQIVRVVLDLVSAAYLDYSLESRQADIRLGLDFVEKKIPDLRERVDDFAGRLQSLRLENNLIDPGSRGGQLTGQAATFAQQQLEVRSQLSQVQDAYANLTQQLANPRVQASSSALAQNPRYQRVLDELLALDAAIAEASTLYLETSPEMEVLLEERENLRNLLAEQGLQTQEELQTQIRELTSRDRALTTALNEINSNIDNLSFISRDYTDIERELQIATNNLNQFLAKREALQIDAAQGELPWEIVTPPTTPRSQPESLPQNLVLGAILGILLGVASALLFDRATGVIYGDTDIRKTTRLPILARIPNNRILNGTGAQESVTESLQYVGANIKDSAAAVITEDAPINVTDRDQSISSEQTNGQSRSYQSDPFSEAFRLLFTNLRLLDSDNPLKSVVITSVMPEEGKSTVAIYLAETAAAMGQRVLLVDADLRNASIHQYLELPNDLGLTNLCSGDSNSAAIQKLSTEPNMYVLCSGSIAVEPARLLSSRSMAQVIDRLQSTFDLIIFDTPPLLGQSDAYLASNHADGVLLVTHPGKLRQPLLDRAMEQLKIANINVLGVVSRES
ncbi:polysaccharide biosynthesis tyrosine autokinase [cf. Phormidesmis sp. LEGE 11477]|uniref:GumC family protein n=1 Tax=cf. Phormidesmis sp. LEGE 11477 TaxID=1828680 RepID=UPI00187F7310|nr:polysaccharide biosynthesis tyrosine autokinase [cf. Phormidesmis sp. LEGE 11477]MBE9061244.1 polysaccharide biosynthesis tyrosine autokinase [cf. Phormidesmis sp. LEGE 11477]